ncbi:MAG: N-acetylmuramoyl-L-alanine amidase [Pseudomonadota bacterium]
MRRLLVLPPLVILLLCGFLAVGDDPSRSVEVASIRLGEDGKGTTRIVFDLDARPDYLIGPVDSGAPELVIHLDGGRFTVVGGSGSQDGKGLVDTVHYGPNVVRLELKGSALPSRSFIMPPSGDITYHRLVIDVEAAAPQVFAAEASKFQAPLKEPQTEPAVQVAELAPQAAPATAKKLPPSPSLKPSRAEVILADLPPLPPVMAPTIVKARPLIVLDPGHGGRDPGAIGAGGTLEKDIALSYSRALKSTLERRGYDVILTRSDDTYVAHEDRIGLARDRDADLFLSVHADSNTDKTLRGGSVYTLNPRRSDRMGEEIRSTGNFILYDVEVTTEDGVGDILLDLAQSTTQQNNDRLARALVASMRGTMPLVKNPKRDGALLVLLAPDVPAVLVELAFLSNSRDEANLRSTTWRRSAVNAIADGVDSYFDEAGLDGRLAGGLANSG